MIRSVVKCTVLFKPSFGRGQCLSICGFHSTAVFKSNKITYGSNDSKPYQSVADFYAGKSVFLTGATGFLGKVFIEQLLSKCSQLDKIFVLIRGKKGAPAEQRLQELLQTPVFTKLKNENPEYLSKVVAISGDVTEPKLGITPEDEKTLIDKVSIVFHSAAQVRFIEPFKDIIKINVDGTRNVMNLGKQMKNLKKFVHISTAFSNSDKLLIEEIVYPPSKKLDDVYFFLKNYGHDEEEVAKYTKGHANTYTFSKNLAESLVFEEHGHMPTIIVRPSIVTPVFKDPMPGWVDSWVASTAIFSDIARGLTRIMYGKKDVSIDMIPVDYVCNLAIVAAAKNSKTKEVTVYNSCSNSVIPMTWKGGAELFLKHSDKFDYKEIPWPRIYTSESPLVVSTLTFLLQVVPSFLADLCLKATGKKPSYMNVQSRAILLRDVLKNFTSTSFIMKSDRVQELLSSLDEKDRQKFVFDPKTLDWNEYMPLYCFGIKQYLLKNKS